MRSFLKKDRQVSPGQSMTEGEARVFTTILIVDDSPTEIHVIKGIVEKGGYKVITADSGENGIVEATRRIKSQWPQVKIVALTLYAWRRAEALAAGADAVLLKGCKVEALQAAIMPFNR